MRHRTTTRFRESFAGLPANIRRKADKAFALMKADPAHPSLHFKKTGRVWSARVDAGYRALALREDDDCIWFWIGRHDEYERIILGL